MFRGVQNRAKQRILYSLNSRRFLVVLENLLYRS